jgi:D-aminoacyl-tRNA deacylase
MRAVVQRVRRASVTVDEHVVGEIGPGLLVLLGVSHGDSVTIAQKLADKVAGLRIFEDSDGKMNRAAAEVGGGVLCISQFTLYGDVRRGRRPSFDAAAPPSIAEPLYETFCDAIAGHGLVCERGVFGAHMDVRLLNDGPVTLIIDSAELEQPRRT